jgi:hypothetical protein
MAGSTGMTAPVAVGSAARDAAEARRMLWLAFWTMLVSIGIGVPWDTSWHTARPLDDLLSPPHVLVTTTCAVTVAAYVYLLLAGRLRAAFGSAIRLPVLAAEVPGSLALIGGGLLLLTLGALLDAVWHALFGLDETRWAGPHALLGWGWVVAAFGFVSARLALHPHQPLHWWTRIFLGLVLLSFSIGPILGPFQHNQTVEKVETVGAIPVLTDQAAYQHTVEIYLDWHIVRAHALFVVLGAFWVGLSLALLRAVDHRLAYVVALVSFWTASALVRDWSLADRLGIVPESVASWFPVPVLPAALAMTALWRLRYGELAAAAAGGAVFGLVSQVVWPSVGPLAGAAVGAPFAAIGALIGARLGLVLVHPTVRGCALVIAATLGASAICGAADLFLRLHTP